MVGKFSQVRGQEIPQPKWGIFSHDFRGTPTFPATHLPHMPDSRGLVWVLEWWLPFESTDHARPTAQHNTHVNSLKPLNSSASYRGFIPSLQMWKQKPKAVKSLPEVTVERGSLPGARDHNIFCLTLCCCGKNTSHEISTNSKWT